MPRFFTRLSAIFFALALQASAASGAACDPSVAEANLQRWHERYAETTWRVLEEGAAERHGGYTRQQGTILVKGNGRAITSQYVYYRVSGEAKAPLVFLYSGLVGINPLDHLMARHFAKRGISVVVSHDLDLNLAHTIETMAEGLIRTLGVGWALTDIFTSRPEVDAARIGVLGYSYGGLRAYHQMAIDPRLKAAVVIGAGAPVSDVLAYSRFSVAELIRNWQMARARLNSPGAYRTMLQNQTDVLSQSELACAHPADDYYLFISKFDTWAPTFTQWQLWETLGRPRYEVVATGHVETVIAVGATRLDAMIAFFKERWAS